MIFGWYPLLAKKGEMPVVARCVIVSEFCKSKKLIPVVLLIIAVDSEELFEGLIGVFGLTVSFGMITGSEV